MYNVGRCDFWSRFSFMEELSIYYWQLVFRLFSSSVCRDTCDSRYLTNVFCMGRGGEEPCGRILARYTYRRLFYHDWVMSVILLWSAVGQMIEVLACRQDEPKTVTFILVAHKVFTYSSL